MLMGVSAFAQKPKFIIIKTYKDGKATVSKIIPIAQPAPPVPTPVVKIQQKVKIKQVVKKVEIPVEVIKTVTDDRKIDSLHAVIMSYNIINHVSDSYLLDHNQGIIVVKEQVLGNKIINRKWTADIQPITKEKIVEIYRPKEVQWFMGPHITTNFTQPLQSFGLSIVRKDLNDNLLQLQVGGNVHEGTLRPNAYFGVGVLLKLN